MKLPKVGLAWGKGPVPARPPQRRRLLSRATVPSSSDARPPSARPRAQSIAVPEKSLCGPVWGCGGALPLGLWTVPTLHPSCHLRALAGRFALPADTRKPGAGPLKSCSLQQQQPREQPVAFPGAPPPHSESASAGPWRSPFPPAF